jgi:hypothetical protein
MLMHIYADDASAQHAAELIADALAVEKIQKLLNNASSRYQKCQGNFRKCYELYSELVSCMSVADIFLQTLMVDMIVTFAEEQVDWTQQNLGDLDAIIKHVFQVKLTPSQLKRIKHTLLVLTERYLNAQQYHNGFSTVIYNANELVTHHYGKDTELNSAAAQSILNDRLLLAFAGDSSQIATIFKLAQTHDQARIYAIIILLKSKQIEIAREFSACIVDVPFKRVADSLLEQYLSEECPKQ